MLGGFIGLERKFNHRPAGLRTHILVTTSACVAILINKEIFNTYSSISNVDPGRMASYVISGVGFLGAGTIIREGASVKGLTTAAGIWASAIIGLACGMKMYKLGITFALLVIFTLFFMNKIDHKISVEPTFEHEQFLD